jgi:hypothetical protein
MRPRVAALVLSLALVSSACGGDVTAPDARPVPEEAAFQRPESGTGLALESFTGGLPIVGDIQITEVVLTEFSTFLGGLQVSGTITGTSVSIPGLTVTEDFTTDVLVSSSSTGRCDLVTIDLAPIAADVFGVVGVDIPVANVSGRGSGAVGSLLCVLGSIVTPVVGGVVSGLVAALNALLAGGSLPGL